MNIGVIGAGVVGGALISYLSKHTQHEVRIFDPPKGFEDEFVFTDCSAVFICVPVPTKSLKQDTSILKNAIQACDHLSTIFVRSSVLPGTCDALGEKYNRYVCAMPEFLTARHPDECMERLDLTIGIPDRAGENETWQLQRLVFEIFKDRKKCTFVPNNVAEMGKYIHNTFGASKVTFFNAIHRICEINNIDYEQAIKVALGTGYINEMHTKVPGPDGKKGFGGTCFPKDLAAFIGFVGKDCTHLLFRDILCLNRFFRGEKDFDDGTEDLPESKCST